MTVGEVISTVKSLNKDLFDDSLISDRFLYKIISSTANELIKRELNQRKLLNSSNVFTPLECLPLKEVSITECNIDSCNKIRRSVDKLPKLSEGIYDYAIQGVYNVNNSEEIFPTSIREYINLSKLRFKPVKEYYLIKDDYLYILNPNIESVNIYAYFSDTFFKMDKCSSYYEAEFKIPQYLEKSLYSIVRNDLIDYNKKGKDITDNNLEEKQ